MQLSLEIDKVFARLAHGLVDPEVARCAIEQVVAAHARKPAAQLDATLRTTLDGLRHRGADYAVIRAQIEAWIHVRADVEDCADTWV